MFSGGDIDKEAKAFDDRIEERVANGHIPDLRCVEPCEWFYNNVWRHPALVDMVYGRMFRYALRHLHGSAKNVLEVGSGPGYISLELARHGFNVTGLELSSASVKVAREYAEKNPYKDEMGELSYVNEDFFKWNVKDASFDGVCFFQTLHHFPDVNAAIDKAYKLLKPGGVMIVNEPSRDVLERKDAVAFAAIRLMLDSQGAWYEDLAPMREPEAFEKYVDQVLAEYREAHDADEGPQSEHDNSSYSAEILSVLNSKMRQIDREPDYAFVPRTVGGIRASTEKRMLELANMICTLDDSMVYSGVVNEGGFFWAGVKNI